MPTYKNIDDLRQYIPPDNGLDLDKTNRHIAILVKAEAILAVVPTIVDLCGKSAKEIADIPAGKGRIGPKLGGDIHGALH